LCSKLDGEKSGSEISEMWEAFMTSTDFEAKWLTLGGTARKQRCLHGGWQMTKVSLRIVTALTVGVALTLVLASQGAGRLLNRKLHRSISARLTQRTQMSPPSN
jgi:hypothetical protein